MSGITIFNAPSNYCGALSSDPSITVAGMFYYNTGSGQFKYYNGSAWTALASGGGSGDASTNTSSSVDSEVVLFSGTGGKTLKRASATGIAKLASGVLSAVTAPSGAIVGDTDTQTLSAKTLASPTITGTISFPDGVRQTFNPDNTNAGLNVGANASDPASPSNGDLWYNSGSNALKARINGATVTLGSGGTTYNESNPIVDSSSHNLLAFTKVASAVNYATISNNSTGNGVIFSATGSDTNIRCTISSKGSGELVLSASAINLGSYTSGNIQLLVGRTSGLLEVANYNASIYAKIKADTYHAEPTGQYDFMAYASSPDAGIKREASAVVAISDGSTGYGKLRLVSSTPSTSSDAGTQNTIWVDGSYIYVQTGATTVKRVALSTF